MVNFRILIGELYEDIRIDPDCELLLQDKNICVFVKNETPSSIISMLGGWLNEDDFYSLERTNGCLLFIQPHLFEELNTVITDTGTIVQVQTH